MNKNILLLLIIVLAINCSEKSSDSRDLLIEPQNMEDFWPLEIGYSWNYGFLYDYPYDLGKAYAEGEQRITVKSVIKSDSQIVYDLTANFEYLYTNQSWAPGGNIDTTFSVSASIDFQIVEDSEGNLAWPEKPIPSKGALLLSMLYHGFLFLTPERYYTADDNITKIILGDTPPLRPFTFGDVMILEKDVGLVYYETRNNDYDAQYPKKFKMDLLEFNSE